MKGPALALALALASAGCSRSIEVVVEQAAGGAYGLSTYRCCEVPGVITTQSC